MFTTTMSKKRVPPTELRRSARLQTAQREVQLVDPDVSMFDKLVLLVSPVWLSNVLGDIVAQYCCQEIPMTLVSTKQECPDSSSVNWYQPLLNGDVAAICGQLLGIYRNGQQVNAFGGSRGAYRSMCILSTGDLVMSGFTGIIRVWLSARRIIQVFRHGSHVNVLLVLPNDDIVSSADFVNTIKIWRDGHCIETLFAQEPVSCLSVRGNGDLVSASLGNLGCIQVWRAAQCIQTFAHGRPVILLLVLPNDDIVSGSIDGSMKIWRDGECIATLIVDNRGRSFCLSVLGNGDLVSGCWGGVLQVWRNGVCVKTLRTHQHAIRHLQVLPNGHLVSRDSGGVRCEWLFLQ